jgi:hypothetical protein
MKHSTKRTQDDARSGGDWQGMNWIRQEKRLAIYMRDGLSCAYCGDSVERGAQLGLDHIKPHSKGGSNHATNLVTCCTRCNSSRSNRPLATFCRTVAAYINHGTTGDSILAHVRKCSQRVLPTAEAKALIARRGSAAKALARL